MAKRRKAEVDEFSLALAEEKRLDILRREAAIADGTRKLYDPLWIGYRGALETHFHRHFGNNIDSKTKLATWDLGIAGRRRSFESLTTLFNDQLETVEPELEEYFDEEMFGAFDDGYDRTLWELASLGIDLNDTDQLTNALKGAILVGAAINGLTYIDRLRMWAKDSASRVSQWLKGAMAGGFNLQDTLNGLDNISKGVSSRVVGLGQNEVNRSFLLASETARDPYRDEFQEVWVTSGDRNVCSTCKGLEFAITKLMPIDDSHPGCRCRKVMVSTHQGRIVDYVGFLASIGRR